MVVTVCPLASGVVNSITGKGAALDAEAELGTSEEALAGSLDKAEETAATEETPTDAEADAGNDDTTDDAILEITVEEAPDEP